MRRRKCPTWCPCLCHDTGGGVGHGLGPCPGKTAEGPEELAWLDEQWSEAGGAVVLT